MREKRTDASLGNPNQASAGTKKPAEPEDRVLERTSKASRLTLSGRRPSFGVCGFGVLGFWGFGVWANSSNKATARCKVAFVYRKEDSWLITRQSQLTHSLFGRTLLQCEARTFAASFWS